MPPSSPPLAETWQVLPLGDELYFHALPSSPPLAETWQVLPLGDELYFHARPSSPPLAETWQVLPLGDELYFHALIGVLIALPAIGHIRVPRVSTRAPHTT
jgi:hypothetical protein